MWQSCSSAHSYTTALREVTAKARDCFPTSFPSRIHLWPFAGDLITQQGRDDHLRATGNQRDFLTESEYGKWRGGLGGRRRFGDYGRGRRSNFETGSFGP